MSLEKVRSLLSENKITEAILHLYDLVDDPGQLDELQQLEARNNRLQSEVRKGLLSSSERDVLSNRLVDGLIGFLRVVKQQEDSFKEELILTPEVLEERKRRKKLLLGLKKRYRDRINQKLYPRSRFKVSAALTYTTAASSDQIVQDLYRVKQEGQTDVESLFKEYFETIKRLVILGSPGMGKTLLLLEFAVQLIDKALELKDFPIPVVFDLSTWHNDEVYTWMKGVLRYSAGESYISKAYASQLAMQNQILPLLDGFDQVDRAYRKTFEQEIRRYLSDTSGKRLTGVTVPELIICSNLEDYLFEELDVFGAIRIQKFEVEDVNQALQPLVKDHDPSALRLQKSLQNVAHLQEILLTPFALKIALRVAERKNEQLFQQITSEAALVEVYIAEELETISRSEASLTGEQLKRYLANLAALLNTEPKKGSTFELLSLQPDLLPVKKRWRYRFVYGFLQGFTATLILLFLVVPYKILADSGDANSFEMGPVMTLIYLLAVILCAGTISGLIMGFFFGQDDDYDKPFKPINYLREALISLTWSITFILYWLYLKLSHYDLDTLNVWVDLVLAPIVIAVTIFVVRVLHRRIRLFRPMVYSIEPGEVFTWAPSWRLFTRRSTRFLMKNLRTGGKFGGYLAPVILVFAYFNEPQSLTLELSAKVFVFVPVMGWLIGGLLGLLGGIIENQFIITSIPQIDKPYQKFFLPIRHDFLVSFSVLLISILLISTIPDISPSSKGGWNFIVWVLELVMLGMPLLFLYAFNDLMKHLAIRLVMSYQQVVPLKLVGFLEAITERSGLLEKDGGQWRFKHQNIQNWFLDYSRTSSGGSKNTL